VLNDFDNFYSKWLPAKIKGGAYKDLVGELPAARKAYLRDKRKLKGCK
jgi:hypothetical protein